MGSEREQYVRSSIQAVAEDNFPDNPGLDWRILNIEHRDQLAVVEVEPRPDEVGYSRFKFVIAFDEPREPQHLATYALEGGRYVLLCTTASLGRRKLPKVWA